MSNEGANSQQDVILFQTIQYSIMGQGLEI